MAAVFKELSYQIMGCAFDVYEKLGPFFAESVYQRAMEVSLSAAGLSWERQKRVNVVYQGEIVGHGKLDLLVEGKVILELKAASAIHPAFISQALQYLAATDLKLALIINFGAVKKLAYKRVVL